MNKRLLPPLPLGERVGVRGERALLGGLFVLLVALPALLLAGTAGAQTSTSFNLSWYALAGGGARAASTSYALHGTLGQWAALPAVAADDTSYAINSGYWQRWQDLRLYLPLVVKSF